MNKDRTAENNTFNRSTRALGNQGVRAVQLSIRNARQCIDVSDHMPAVHPRRLSPLGSRVAKTLKY
jgi:hypothetical protein